MILFLLLLNYLSFCAFLETSGFEIILRLFVFLFREGKLFLLISVFKLDSVYFLGLLHLREQLWQNINLAFNGLGPTYPSWTMLSQLLSNPLQSKRMRLLKSVDNIMSLGTMGTRRNLEGNGGVVVGGKKKSHWCTGPSGLDEEGKGDWYLISSVTENGCLPYKMALFITVFQGQEQKIPVTAQEEQPRQ